MLDCCRLNVAWDIVNFRFSFLRIIMRQTLFLNSNLIYYLGAPMLFVMLVETPLTDRWPVLAPAFWVDECTPATAAADASVGCGLDPLAKAGQCSA